MRISGPGVLSFRLAREPLALPRPHPPQRLQLDLQDPLCGGNYFGQARHLPALAHWGVASPPFPHRFPSLLQSAPPRPLIGLFTPSQTVRWAHLLPSPPCSAHTHSPECRSTESLLASMGRLLPLWGTCPSRHL